MAKVLLKEKFKIVKSYLNEIDPSFRFITFPIVINPANTIQILQLIPVPTLCFYKNISNDLEFIID